MYVIQIYFIKIIIFSIQKYTVTKHLHNSFFLLEQVFSYKIYGLELRLGAIKTVNIDIYLQKVNIQQDSNKPR